jgi:acyl-CoA synthetase (AMP-forming)/AMP-acid ligase II
MLQRVAGVLPCIIRQGFGMTELAGVGHIPGRYTNPDDCGLPLPGLESRIVDEAGRPLPPGADGEVWIRGTQVMQGYWHNPEATAATIVDGWLRTGDIGHLDGAGNLTIVDRVKELIKSNGFQVAPAELEGVLLTHPAVADAAVIGIADDTAGEFPKALVALRPGHEASPDELMAYVNDRLARYKHLHHLEFIDAVPRTPAGKILRRALRG